MCISGLNKQYKLHKTIFIEHKLDARWIGELTSSLAVLPAGIYNMKWEPDMGVLFILESSSLYIHSEVAMFLQHAIIQCD
jgi:hypothetical protein